MGTKKLGIEHRMLPGLSHRQTAPKLDKTFLLKWDNEDDSANKFLGGSGREWQEEAFKVLCDSQFGLGIAFCGSGKSILQVYLAAYDYIHSAFCQRQLLVVPQSVIAPGFVSNGEHEFILLHLEGKEYEWRVRDNFCDDRPDVLNLLEKFLLEPVSPGNRRLGKNKGELTGGIAVTTHQALSLVWARLKPAQRKKALHNLTLRVDEAHHVKGVFHLSDDNYTPEEKATMEAESTHLGSICHAILNSGDPTAKMHFTTATPYRGDAGIILSPQAQDKFVQYCLPWGKHWNTLGIEVFSIFYEEYDANPFDLVIDRILSEPKERHMIIIPSTGNKWRVDGKAYARFLKKLYAAIPEAEVLDLVTRSTQKQNRNKLTKEPKSTKDGPSKYRVVVTCMVGREGLDWVPCSRLHNTSIEQSLTLAVQTTGRPLRRYYPTKTSVVIYNYVPSLEGVTNQEEKRALFSDRSNGVLLGMQWDDLTETLMLTVLPVKGGKSTESKKVGLMEIFGSKYPAAMAALIEEVSSLDALTDAGITEACYAIIDEFKPQVNVDEEELVAALRKAVLRRIQASQPETVRDTMRLKGIDITFLRAQGFDKVVAQYGVDHRTWFVGKHGSKDWDEIKHILRSTVADFEQQCIEVEAYQARKKAA